MFELQKWIVERIPIWVIVVLLALALILSVKENIRFFKKRKRRVFWLAAIDGMEYTDKKPEKDFPGSKWVKVEEVFEDE